MISDGSRVEFSVNSSGFWRWHINVRSVSLTPISLFSTNQAPQYLFTVGVVAHSFICIPVVLLWTLLTISSMIMYHAAKQIALNRSINARFNGSVNISSMNLSDQIWIKKKKEKNLLDVVELTNLQWLWDAIMSAWTRISKQCFQHFYVIRATNNWGCSESKGDPTQCYHHALVSVLFSNAIINSWFLPHITPSWPFISLKPLCIIALHKICYLPLAFLRRT